MNLINCSRAMAYVKNRMSLIDDCKSIARDSWKCIESGYNANTWKLKKNKILVVIHVLLKNAAISFQFFIPLLTDNHGSNRGGSPTEIVPMSSSLKRLFQNTTFDVHKSRLCLIDCLWINGDEILCRLTANHQVISTNRLTKHFISLVSSIETPSDWRGYGRWPIRFIDRKLNSSVHLCCRPSKERGISRAIC